MDPHTLDFTAAALVFAVALVFSMLGLGGGMLYVPLFKWLELPLKTVAIPLSLLLNDCGDLQWLFLAGKGAERETLVSSTGGPAGFWLVLLAGLAWAGYGLGDRMEARHRP